jgi:hypothetical protein
LMMTLTFIVTITTNNGRRLMFLGIGDLQMLSRRDHSRRLFHLNRKL